MKNTEVIFILKQIVLEYKSHFGETKGELSTWAFDDDLKSKNRKIEKACLAAAPDPIQINKYWQKTMKHLEIEGYIECKNGKYFLTNIGYEKGAQTNLECAISYLNLNPSIAIIISIIALFVSIFALFN